MTRKAGRAKNAPGGVLSRPLGASTSIGGALTPRQVFVRALILVHDALAMYRVTLMLMISLGIVPALIIGILPWGRRSFAEFIALSTLAVLGLGGALLTAALGSRKARLLLHAHGIDAPGAANLAFIWSSWRMISRAEALGILDDDYGGRGHADASGFRNHVVEWLIAGAVGTAVPVGVVLLLMTLVPDLSPGAFNAIFLSAMALLLVLLGLLWWRLRRPRGTN